MSNIPKSLMRLYVEGSIISRELEHMMHDYAAEMRFERELTDDADLYADRQHILIHKGNPKGFGDESN